MYFILVISLLGLCKHPSYTVEIFTVSHWPQTVSEPKYDRLFYHMVSDALLMVHLLLTG